MHKCYAMVAVALYYTNASMP